MRFRIPRGIVYFPRQALWALLISFFRGRVFSGEAILKFEEAFARYVGSRNAVSVSSGKLALYLVLKKIGVSRDDEVILPSYTVPEVISMIRCAGCMPRFVDVDARTYNISPELIKDKINSRTKVILMTHLYGRPCDIDGILDIAGKHNLVVVEDSAQACGAEYRGRKTGTFGKAGYFSFGIYKNLNALGGGMLVTDDDGLAREIREEVQGYNFPPARILLKNIFLSLGLRWLTQRFVFTFLVYPLLKIIYSLQGKFLYNALKNKDEKDISALEIPPAITVKFTNLQAEAGLAQLALIDKHNAARARNSERLSSFLSGCGLALPETAPQAKSIYLNYVICVRNRSQVMKEMFRRGIDVTNGYLEACSALEEFKVYKAECPVSERIARENLYIPVHHYLSPEDIEYIAESLKIILGNNNGEKSDNI